MQVTNNKQEKIFIGVSWPYANGNIHLGHLAGQNVVTDVFARYHRLKGNSVLMVSGSDSHGAPILTKAEERGIPPEQLVEESHAKIVETFKKLGFLYENYTKTTTENHKIVVQNIFNVLNELGYLEVKETEQYYDGKVKRFLPDRYVKGTCPNCKATNARGDECPECGAYLNPTDLIDPYSTLSDAKPKLKKTKHFYLNLSKLQPEISKWVKASDKPWRKWVREFTRGWLKQGLEPRAVTRDLTFGVKVPIEGWEDKVIYVWIEAVVGYLSAAIEWAEKQGSPSLWESFWKDESAKHYYFVAGGNVPFHTVMWPAEIVAYNEKYGNSELREKYKLPGETSSKPLNLPFDVPANKMLLYKGKKMSKGDGTGINLDAVIDKYNPDLLRYFFVRYAPENHDREYTWKDFIDSNNNELVANIGNFINRVLTFTENKFDGVVPEGYLEDDVREAIQSTFKKVGKSIEACKFVQSIEYILELGKFANKYFNDQAPWERIKSDKEIAGNTIYNNVQIVNALRTLIKPYLPFASRNISTFLNIKDEYDQNEELEANGYVSKVVNNWNFTEIPAGTKLNKANILFEKLEYGDELKGVDEG
ncbi:methionine--tRNA ligase [Candidatus Dojkabacteria bacterium]|nr:methionine--tRNA ligase [Candidatus Dojkabacteria bacterium]